MAQPVNFSSVLNDGKNLLDRSVSMLTHQIGHRYTSRQCPNLVFSHAPPLRHSRLSLSIMDRSVLGRWTWSQGPEVSVIEGDDEIALALVLVSNVSVVTLRASSPAVPDLRLHPQNRPAPRV